MKSILSLLVLLPNLAFAHSTVRCIADGDFADIELTVITETSLLDQASVARIIGDGAMRDVDVTAQVLRQPTIPDQLVVKIQTFKTGTTVVDENGIEAILTLKTRTLPQAQALTEADGIGNLQITKDTANRIRRSNYSLRECTGLL